MVAVHSLRQNFITYDADGNILESRSASSSSRLLPSSSPPLSFPVDHVSRGDRRTSNISVPSSASSRNVLAPDRPQTLGRISPASSTKAEFVSATSSGRVREDIYHSFNSGSGSVDRYNSKVSWWADAIP